MINQIKFRGKCVFYPNSACQNSSKLEHNKILLQYPMLHIIHIYIINSCHCNVPNYIRSFLIEKHRYKSLMPEQSGCLLIYYCRWETLLWLLQGWMQCTPAFQKSNLPAYKHYPGPRMPGWGQPKAQPLPWLCWSLLSLSQHCPELTCFPGDQHLQSGL